MNILVFSTMPWNFLWQRPHQVASRLAARGNNVVYFQNPIFLDPFLVIKNFKERNIFLRRKLGNNLFLANMFLLPFCGKLRFVTEKFGLMFLKMHLMSLKFKPDVAIFYSYQYNFLLENLRSMGVKVVYDCIDDFSGFSDVGDWVSVLRFEKELAAKASFVTAASRTLSERLSKINMNCLYVPNGVDFGHFNSALHVVEKPEEVKNLKHPVVGFIGAIYDWFNADLICRLAEVHPDYSILLVGPVEYGLGKLRKYSNIKMVGAKPYGIIPQYLACMDVCLIPFKINKLTLASNPIKLYEYLAAGKPVVSTALPEICENASGLVYIAKDEEDFIRKVEEAVKEAESPNKEVVEKRIKFAKENSWEKRIDVIENLLRRD